MTNILLVYLQTNKDTECSLPEPKMEYDTLYILRGTNKTTDQKTIYYDSQYFDLRLIRDTIREYEYILYLDDRWKTEGIDQFVTTGLQLVRDGIDQVIFTKCESPTKKIEIEGITVEIPLLTKNSCTDMWKRFEKMKSIFTNKINPYSRTKKEDINYDKYARKEYNKYRCFQLLPSLIKTKFIELDQQLTINPHHQHVYAETLAKTGFKNCYLGEPIEKIPLSTPLCERSDRENMTIVTGFIDLQLNRPPKYKTQIYDYIEQSRQTLSIEQKMVVYVTKNLIDHVKNIRATLMSKTKIVEVTKDDLYMVLETSRFTKLTKNNRPPYNDPRLLLAVNTRYQHLKRAIQANYFGTDYFAWVDFSAGHIVSIPRNRIITSLSPGVIRIGWIGRFKSNRFSYNHHALGGGVFAGHRDIMQELIKLHDIEFMYMAKQGYCINDDRLLFFIFEKYPYLFDIFFSAYAHLFIKMSNSKI